MFRVYGRSAKIRAEWEILAVRFKVYGTVGTHETGGEKLARIYHHLTLPTTMKRVRKYINKTTNVIDWERVDRIDQGFY